MHTTRPSTRAGARQGLERLSPSATYALVFVVLAEAILLRYLLEHTSLDTAGGLAEFQAAPGEAGEALGEELGEFFDVDFGI